MLKKIKEYIDKKQKLKKEKVELVKLQRYYALLRSGVAFVQFVQNDLKGAGEKMNRHQRRRLEKTVLKGEFNEELVQHYKGRVEEVLVKIQAELEKK